MLLCIYAYVCGSYRRKKKTERKTVIREFKLLGDIQVNANFFLFTDEPVSAS